MKKMMSMILVLMLFVTGLMEAPAVRASSKSKETRAIAIVFDNSGSMYNNGDQAWCRATYAMKVFASMLNKGDTLLIYPMHPITVGEKTYTMDDPFRRTEAEQAHVIRDTSFGGSITGGNKEERRGERPEAACVREEHAGGWENLMPVMRK